MNQVDEEELLKLPEEVLRRLSVRLLTDLEEARECLKQKSRNSSRLLSNEAPWAKERTSADSTDEIEEAEVGQSDDETRSGPSKNSYRSSNEAAQEQTEEARKPGKQTGAEGFGRQQTLAVNGWEGHYPEFCACYDQPLNPDGKKVWTAFETSGLEWGEENQPGLQLTNTRHSYYEIPCQCGHVTRKEPRRTVPLDGLPSISCSQWLLVRPGLAALIVCLPYRMQLSHERIREFLEDWMRLQLCVGAIHHTLQESGAAALLIEEELIQAVRERPLLHSDETLDREAQRFGTRTLESLSTLIAGVQEARNSPPSTPSTETYRTQLVAYRYLCEHIKTVFHRPTQELATEMLNDWDAIFWVLEYPYLPLTNNEAERALRHWFILRRVCYGTRTDQASRGYALLISVNETCRKRRQSPWGYLAAVIHSNRAGLAAPKMPVAKGSE